MSSIPKNNRNAVFTCLLFICLTIYGTYSNTASAQSNAWILGTWELSFDPDGDSKDSMVFNKNYSFVSLGGNGQKFNGSYEINNGRVKVTLNHQGQPFMSFFLGFEKNKDTLYYYSEDTKKTSVYKKTN